VQDESRKHEAEGEASGTGVRIGKTAAGAGGDRMEEEEGMEACQCVATVTSTGGGRPSGKELWGSTGAGFGIEAMEQDEKSKARGRRSSTGDQSKDQHSGSRCRG